MKVDASRAPTHKERRGQEEKQASPQMRQAPRLYLQLKFLLSLKFTPMFFFNFLIKEM